MGGNLTSWQDRQYTEDELRKLKTDSRSQIYRATVTKRIDWEYPILKFFKKLFRRKN